LIFKNKKQQGEIFGCKLKQWENNCKIVDLFMEKVLILNGNTHNKTISHLINLQWNEFIYLPVNQELKHKEM
jgi:hypothetical protein